MTSFHSRELLPVQLSRQRQDSRHFLLVLPLTPRPLPHLLRFCDGPELDCLARHSLQVQNLSVSPTRLHALGGQKHVYLAFGHVPSVEHIGAYKNVLCMRNETDLA